MLGSVPVRGVAHCAAKLDAGRKVPAVQEEDDEPPLPLEPPQPEAPTTAIAATNHALGNLTERSYRDYNVPVEGCVFEEAAFFRAIAASGVRALLIGRRALIALGIPVLTADYDFWLHIDDIAPFNAAIAPMGLVPTHAPEEARARGRYVAENDERVDVLVARSVSTVDGVKVAFDELWPRRRGLEVAPGVVIPVPATPDLILTKRFGGRPKDLEDIRLLEALRGEEAP